MPRLGQGAAPASSDGLGPFGPKLIPSMGGVTTLTRLTTIQAIIRRNVLSLSSASRAEEALSAIIRPPFIATLAHGRLAEIVAGRAMNARTEMDGTELQVAMALVDALPGQLVPIDLVGAPSAVSLELGVLEGVDGLKLISLVIPTRTNQVPISVATSYAAPLAIRLMTNTLTDEARLASD